MKILELAEARHYGGDTSRADRLIPRSSMSHHLQQLFHQNLHCTFVITFTFKKIDRRENISGYQTRQRRQNRARFDLIQEH